MKLFNNVPICEIKETKDGDLIVKGYIATTHLDSGFYDDSREVYCRDRINRKTLDKWAYEINQGIPSANKVSVNHNRIPHVAGVGIKGTARVDSLPDGEYGLYVETLVDKTREDFKEIKYRIEKGLLDSFSIEFTTKDQITKEYIPNAVREFRVEQGLIRELLPNTDLQGWTLASQPMNEYAVMVKEFYRKQNNTNEVKTMKSNEQEEQEESVEQEDASQSKPVAKKSAKPAHMNLSDGVGTATSNPYYGKPAVGKEVSDEDFAILREYKEKKAREAMFDSVKEAVKAEVKEGLKSFKVENKIGLDNHSTIESKEISDYKQMFQNKDKIDAKEQMRIAARFCESKGWLNGEIKTRTPVESRQYKFSTNGSKLEFKGLGITSNQNTDTDYLLSAAELQDSFDPVIYNALNQQTVTWNILNKDDYSNKGNNMVQFVLKTAANTTAAAYTGNAISTGVVTRLKLETKFKKYQVGVEVDGDMIAAARGGPIGDVFAQEVMDSTIDLLSVMNQALFDTTPYGLETAAQIISFRYLTDSASNTTLYNLTRSTTNKLAPASAGDTYINQASARISLTNLRKAKTQALKDGSMLQNLVFVTNHTQCDLFRAVYDAAYRYEIPTSKRMGFEGRLAFDGVPIFEDKDCSTSSWYLIDLDSTRVAIWVPPTLEMLGKDADSQKGFIKCYWALYCRHPRRIVEIYGCATS
jgi:hypothetical protein